jgi:hypothetical protein
MARTADCPQNTWQAKFKEYPLNPFTSDAKGLRYQRFDNPASWWHNPVNPNSLRLTRPAFTMLEKAKVANTRFKLTAEILPKTMIQLEKHFTSPYYLYGKDTIFVYGDTEMMMLALHGNDLQQYLNNQDPTA